MPITRAQSGVRTRAAAKKKGQGRSDTKTGIKRTTSKRVSRKSPPKRVRLDNQVDTKDENGTEVKEETKFSETPKEDTGKDTTIEVESEKEIKPKEEKAEQSTTEKACSYSPAVKFQPQKGILERGHIYFFYRPKVGIEESENIDDIARLSILLVPRPPKPEEDKTGIPSIAHEDELPIGYFRYIVMGKKQLPDSETKHEVFWGSVTEVGDNLNELEEGLGEQVYETKTRGERRKGAVRLAGRGVYIFCTPTDPKLPPSRGERTFLAYNLTHPATPGEVQEELGIEASSSFLIQVKNPNQPNPPNVGLKPEKKAKYPEEGQKEAFGTGVAARRFQPANPPALLDYQGAEVLLIGDKKNLDTVLSEGSMHEMQQEAIDESQTLTTEAVMKEVMLDTNRFSSDALEGHWV